VDVYGINTPQVPSWSTPKSSGIFNGVFFT
jgi:hypothetical protein